MERQLYSVHLLFPVIVVVNVNSCITLNSHQTVFECCYYSDAISSNQPDVQYLIKSRKLDTTKRWESERHGGQPDISKILFDKSCFTAASGTVFVRPLSL